MRRAAALKSEPDVARILTSGIRVLSADELLDLAIEAPSELIEGILPADSATLIVGESKNGKTLLAVQIGIAVAGGRALCENYRVLGKGPVLIIEQDDPRGAASIKDILKAAPSDVEVRKLPLYMIDKPPFSLGPEFVDWLESEIRLRRLKLCILDSYTALRSTRGGAGIDIVKAEQQDMSQLDDLARRTNCAVVLIHHGSKGAAGQKWTSQAAGTFAMSASTEAQIHVSRYPEFDSNAPERLVRIRGRHMEDREITLRFRREHLDYEHVLEGPPASIYPMLVTIQNLFGSQVITPHALCKETGCSRPTAHRHITILSRSGVLSKRGRGEYVITETRR